MTRYKKIQKLSIVEMAKQIVKLNFTDAYCKGALTDQDTGSCFCHKKQELQCCVTWLQEEV